MKDLRLWLDNVLGRITMYRLVIYGLLAIDLFALPLMANGYLSYTPFHFLLGITLAVATSYAANRLFGWLFGLHPNAESAIISGLIIALIFSPPATIVAGIKIIVVAIIAMMSKYLLAIRSKHIFNPVAIAAVIASVTGFAFATWWVGSPALLPVTAIVALLILYKTEKLRMGLAFLVVSMAIIYLSSLQQNGASIHALWLILTSWPLVFFMGVMLSEPLTAAPRRWQQLAVAVLVGALLPLDFHYGKLSMTPALALVVGNAVSFWFSVRRTVKLRLVSIEKRGQDVHELIFDVAPLQFVPGQYIELSVPHAHADSRGIRRVFSIIGQPGDTQLAIATRVPQKPSSFKRALLALKPGRTIYGTRVAGDFVLPNDLTVPILCIAGGIGITPYMSFLETADNRNVTLLYAVRSKDDIVFADKLRHHNAKVVIVSPDDATLPDKDWVHEKGMLSQDLVSKYVTPETHVYISGPPGMVAAVHGHAKQSGAQHVHTDSFVGY